MEERLGELTESWKHAAQVGDLLTVLVSWRKEKPDSAEVIHRLLRIIYTSWVMEIKLDEFSIYENILTKAEQERCRNLAGWTIAEEDVAEPPVDKWTMEGVARLSRAFVHDSHITELMSYPMYDWEILCGKLGTAINSRREEIEERCFRSIKQFVSSPRILESLSITG
jgi:hypothetical protein